MGFKHSNPCLDYKWGSFWCNALLKLGFYWQPLIWHVITCNMMLFFFNTSMCRNDRTQCIHCILCKELLIWVVSFVYLLLLYIQFMFFKGGAFWWKITSPQSLDLIQKSSKAHFALVISHSAAENKLMFIYHILKSLLSRAQLVKTGVK